MEKVHVRLVLEVLGRPKEEVSKALHGLVQRMGTEKGVVVKQQTLHEPVPVKESKDLFTTFGEIEVELDTISHFFMILFGYMPAHIEIMSPQTISVSNAELTETANRIAIKLHEYDAIAKKMLYERNILVKKIQEIAPNVLKELAAPKLPQVVQAPKKASKKKSSKKKK